MSTQYIHNLYVCLTAYFFLVEYIFYENLFVTVYVRKLISEQLPRFYLLSIDQFKVLRLRLKFFAIV